MHNEKFKIEQVTKQGKKIIHLRGIIDEDAKFDAIQKLGGPFVFNFRGVTSINSCGIRNWVNFLKEISSVAITYEECPPLIVRQLNMVPSFLGNAKVDSVFVPYICNACETEKMFLVDTAGFKNLEETAPCDSCKKGEMELDGNQDQYFAFAK